MILPLAQYNPKKVHSLELATIASPFCDKVAGEAATDVAHEIESEIALHRIERVMAHTHVRSGFILFLEKGWCL